MGSLAFDEFGRPFLIMKVDKFNMNKLGEVKKNKK